MEQSGGREPEGDTVLNARWLILLPVLLLAAACGPGGGSASARAAAGERPAGFRLPEVDIELQRGTEPRELVRIGARGVAIGTAKEPLAWKFFAEPRRADEAWYLLRTYAPFREAAPEGTLAFDGKGKVKAGAAERRMILEWVRQAAAEAAGGREATAYGLALAWHQGGSSGICSDLSLYLAGEAVATACGWDGEAHGRLDPAALGRFYAWFDRLQPFQAGNVTQEEPNPRNALDVRLIFAGRGPRAATPAEQQEIQAFAAELFAELAARKGGAPPPAPEAPPAKPGAPAPKPAVPAEPTPARLLLPPSAMSPKEEEIQLQLPENPPPVPQAAPAAARSTSPPPPGTPGR